MLSAKPTSSPVINKSHLLAFWSSFFKADFLVSKLPGRTQSNEDTRGRSPDGCGLGSGIYLERKQKLCRRAPAGLRKHSAGSFL